MPEILDHVAYLSQTIGPRPAGTEEEQQAALYITEHLQKEAELSAVIEDFTTSSAAELPRALCCFVTVVITVLSLFLPVLAIPSVILTLVAAALFACEAFDRPVLSRLFGHGVSQNVVAKYEPGYSAENGAQRRRKVVLVARYDSGKVQAELNGPMAGVLSVVRKVVLGAMVFVPVFLLVRSVFFLHATGAIAIVLNVITVIALIVVALPIVAALMHKLAAYNEGANCNASGVAVLMDVATRIGRGRVSDADDQGFDPRVHGERAARESGLIPEGAQLVYEAAAMEPPEMAPQSPEARLAAAKAAVAALSGKPVESSPMSDLASHLVQVNEPPVAAPTAEGMKEMRDETRETFTGVTGYLGSRDAADQGVETAAGDAEDAWFTVAPDGSVTDASAVPANAAVVAGAVGGAAAGVAAGAIAAGAGAGGVAGVAAGGVAGMAAAPAEVDDGVPAWFKKAQQKAKKPASENVSVQRSRYADALDAAMSESASHFSEANQAVSSETEQRLQQMRAGIMEAKAPGFKAAAAGGSAADGNASGGELLTSGATGTALVETEAAPVDNTSARAFSAETDASLSEAAGASFAGERASLSDQATTAMPPIGADEVRGADAYVPPETHIPAFLKERAARNQGMVEGRTVNRIGVDVPGGLEGTGSDAGVLDGAQGVSENASTSARRPITLPDIGASASLPSIAELQKQRAPLADVEEAGKTAAKSLLSMLPAIDLAAPSGTVDADEQSGSRSRAASLRSALPSLSGAIAPQRSVSGAASGADGGENSLSSAAMGASNAASASSFAASDGDGDDGLAASSASVSLTGSFVAGATGAFAPVGDELLENVDPNDIYVDDADDSAFEGHVTETGAFAGPGYVDMPKSRAHKFLDKFRFGKRKEKEEDTPQEWLDVDDSFDARSAGAARGGWESFRQDDASLDAHDDAFDDAPYDSYGEPNVAGYDDGYYEPVDFGGNVPVSTDAVFGDLDFAEDGYDETTSAVADDGFGTLDAFGEQEPTRARGSHAVSPAVESFNAGDTLSNLPPLGNNGAQEEGRASGKRRRWQGGAFNRRLMGRAETLSSPNDFEEDFHDESVAAFGVEAAEEISQIYHFHHPEINTEVWFVALGSELAQNAGMRAFLTEHAQDLRGSIIIDLDAMGAGELSLIEREGSLRSVATSSRMKRYVKKASQATGMDVSSATIGWQDSAASFATKQGYQAMHLAGMDGAKMAYFGQNDDVLENVDEEQLLRNSDFIMELLKNI